MHYCSTNASLPFLLHETRCLLALCSSLSFLGLVLGLLDLTAI